MKRKEPKRILNEFSWIYIFFVVLGIILAIVIPFIPGLVEEVQKALPNYDNVLLTIEVSIITSVLIDLLYFYLIRRYTSGKSNGTVLMVLYCIGVIGNLVGIIFFKGTTSINFVMDAVGLYFLYKSKKTGK